MAKQLTPSTTPSQRTSPPQYRNGSLTASTGYSPEESVPQNQLVNMNQDLLHFADPETLNPQRTYTSLTRTGVVVSPPSLPSQQMISEGADLLNSILDIVTEIGPWFLDLEYEEIKLGCCDPSSVIAWKATSGVLRNVLSDRATTTIEALSKAISERTSQPVVWPATLTDDALESFFLGQNLRWEPVGIFCAMTGIFLGAERDKTLSGAAQKSTGFDRKTVMLQAFQACTQCESFCDRLGAINDLLLSLILLVILLLTWCYGDDSYHVLRELGNMTSVFIALGYHKSVQEDQETPFYLVELRRRSIAYAHDHDKTSACFTNRPSRLSRHFCEIDLPLDIPDSVLTGTAEVFEQYRANLDQNGWSKTVTYHEVARERVIALLCPFMEEALELKNRPMTPGIESRTRHALLELSSTWQSIPAHIRYEAVQSPPSDRHTTIQLQSLRLDYLFTEFLLCTILANAGESDHKKLISTAHEVLNLALLPTRQRQLLENRRSDVEFTLVFFAMPCASVLVLELLRQAQNPKEQPVANRSGMIQDLSVLISCCESVTEPGQNNYTICKQAQSIFSKSLDSILNQGNPEFGAPLYGQPPVPQYNERTTTYAGDDILGDLPQDFVTPDWTTWLDTVGLGFADPLLDQIMWSNDFSLEQTA